MGVDFMRVDFMEGHRCDTIICHYKGVGISDRHETAATTVEGQYTSSQLVSIQEGGVM